MKSKMESSAATFETAGYGLATVSMSCDAIGEGAIRKNLADANLVDRMATLPSQLSYCTQITAHFKSLGFEL